MISHQPIVSVIVPVYNVEEYIRRCVESLLACNLNDIEIILVDDGSTDKSGIICDSYTYDERVKVIHKSNGGLSDARNAGVNIAQGEYICFVDSDDYVDESFFVLFLSLFTSSNIDVVACDYYLINNGKKRVFKRTGIKPLIVYSSEDFIISAIKHNCLYAPSWSYLYKRTFLENNKIFFRKGIKHEDMDFLPVFLLAADTVMYYSNDYYYYDVRNGSITQEYDLQKYYDCMGVFERWYKTFITIKSYKLRKTLLGFLCRNYVYVSRKYKKKNSLLSYYFLYSNSLTLFDVFKVFVFQLMRKEKW